MADNRKARRTKAAVQRPGNVKRPTIGVARVKIPKARLAEMPEAERAFVFMLCHIGNEIVNLQKLFMFTSNMHFSPGIEYDVHYAQSMLIGKVLTGKLSEAWEYIRSAFLSNPRGKVYQPLLERDGAEALDALKKYFGKPNFFSRVRDHFIFHYSGRNAAILARAFQLMQDDEYVFYLSDTFANSHWYSAEAVVNYALLELIEPGDPVKAIDLLIGDTTKVAGWIGRFVDRCIVAVFVKHFGSEFEVFGTAEETTIENVVHASDVRIPYYVIPAAPKG